MKANEAPEKIYVHKSQYWGLRANEHDITKNGIKYVLTDAFIERALEWVRKEIRPYYSDVKYKYEDFKKYMEA